MIYLKIITLIIAIFFSQSCTKKGIIKKTHKENNSEICVNIKQELQNRLSLFDAINKKELRIRNKTKLPSISKPEENSTLSKIVEAIKNAPKDAKYILVDLRFYKDVDLTNIIIASESDFSLTPYLYTSKYSQGFYSLININDKSITISPPENLKTFMPYKIYRPDLVYSELIIYVSNSESIFGNIRFAKDIKVSVIADNIKKPFRLDLREASDMQFNLGKQWIMPVYSFNNSTIINSKITTAYIKYVSNKDSEVSLKKFKKSKVECYLEDDDQFSVED